MLSLPFISLEQKVECLAGEVGHLKGQLQEFLRVTIASLESGLNSSRKIIEYLIGCVLRDEGIAADRELMNNIEILGAKDGKLAARRKKEPQEPTPPPVLPLPIYSSLHNLRVYGNLVTHPWEPETMELKDVRITAVDLQVALGQVLRFTEWYFQEYVRGPHLDPLYRGLPEPVVGAHCEAPPDPAGFVGRLAERKSLCQLLTDGQARVLTVLAPAGMGKTFLTARCALDLAGGWRAGQGVLLWLDLKGLPSFGEASARILASLQEGAKPSDLSIAQLSPTGRIGQIVRLMAERFVLLVLDNFESWLNPQTREPNDPNVTQLLVHCATRAHRGRVLLTSRASVELPGVPATCLAQVQVGPLALSEAEELLRSQGVVGSDAAFTEVWRRVEGNPRLLLMLAEVLQKRRCLDLDQGLARFPSLVTQKAEGLLAEVWAELTLAARNVLQSLAVLRPPTPLSDVQGVVGRLATNAGAAEETLWNDLIPRALVKTTDDGGAFAVEHTLIREYALRQWLAPASAHLAAVAHYQSVLAARPNPDVFHPAFLAVIHHAMAIGDHALAAETLMSDAVSTAMLGQGRYVELLELCRPIAEAAAKLQPLLRLQVRRLTAECFESLGNYSAALQLLEACRQEPGNWQETSEGCRLPTMLCSVLRKLHRYEAAEAAGQKALAIARTLGMADREGWALVALAALERNRGQARKSAHLAKAALEVVDRVADPTLKIDALVALAGTMLAGSNLRRAEDLFREALACCRQTFTINLRREAQVLWSLARIACRQMRNQDGMQLVNQAIEIFQRIGDRTGEGIARKCRGGILQQMGKPYAAEALGELRHALRIAFNLNHRRDVASTLLTLANGFGEEETGSLATACYQTALDIHTAMGHDWKKGRRYLANLRSRLESADIDWSLVERTAAVERFALLGRASGIEPELWQRFMTASDSPPVDPGEEISTATPG